MNSLPKIELTDLGRDLKLDPINIQLLVEKNKDALFTIENEAMDFVTHVYKVYKKRVHLLFPTVVERIHK